MKTRNSKLQNTGMKLFTVGIAILAAGLTHSVQGKEVENGMNSTAGMDAFSGYLVKEREAENKMEDWMLDKSTFFFDFRLDQAEEMPLTLENWMTEINLFPSVADLKNETEEILRFEDWMLNDSLFIEPFEEKAIVQEMARVETETVKRVLGVTFNNVQYGRRSFIIIEVEDPKLEFETWMFDNKFWNKK